MFKEERSLYESRIGPFIDRLKKLLYGKRRDLEVTYCLSGEDPSFEMRPDGPYQPIAPGTVWGENWQHAWFHVKGNVPEECNQKNVVARINLGAEALVFDPHGMPLCSLSVHTIWPPHSFIRDRIPITSRARGGEKIEFWIEASAGQLFGLKLEQEEGNKGPQVYGSYQAAFRYAELAVFRHDIWQLLLDTQVLYSLLQALPEKSVRRRRILRQINLMIDRFRESPEHVEAARSLLKPELAKKAAPSDLQTRAVGHAHIDTAWLWPVEETIRKCARTFASQIILLERYPEYVFGASQPQHYAFVKEHYPQLYERIRELVKAGRIEVQGGMWVEADGNLIGGESMIRQILYGKNFFRDEFGIDVRNLWLPDVFGYSAALPQILRKSGIDYFVTQKISWNQFNRFPHHTFIWKGIDGSGVITHFPPEDNYNSNLAPEALVKARENFDENGFLDEFLTLFGVGDGGSGPTDEMIESGLRQHDLEGTPRVTFGPAQEMLDRLNKFKDKLPLWSGELYLELHRGTLTTQAYNKKMNRVLEHRLRGIEILYSMLPFGNWTSGKLEMMWKALLLHQFHDILPGSSITTVYEESRRVYKGLSKEADNLTEQAGTLLFESDPSKLTIINTLSFRYSRPCCLPADWAGVKLSDAEGREIIAQTEGDRTVIQLDLPPLSVVTLNAEKQGDVKDLLDGCDDYVLENELIRYAFDESGMISQIYDKAVQREVLSPNGKGNVFGFYEDRPVNWDAWDIDIFYENQLLGHPTLVKREWIAKGPVRSGFRQELEIGRSSIRQEIFLSSNSRRLDFETTVDWQEAHKMLRVAFAVDIRSERAAFEIQYGHIFRNTHRNTSLDMAKFEAVGHRFADLSERDYGIALLNDCKYGYKVHDNVIDLNLLRSPISPDPTADRGRHTFTYSLYPHSGDLINSDVLSEAAQLNQPPVLFFGKGGGDVNLPVTLDSEEVLLEVIKKAEREEALILRLYEPYGRRTELTLTFNLAFKEVCEAGLMEETANALQTTGNRLTLAFMPFEIKTLKVFAEEDRQD